MANTEIANLEQKILELTEQLNKLRVANPREEVRNYSFATATGETCLGDLFGEKDTLMVIHNMGQGCRFCTLWADGFNGFVPHLESVLALVLVSKDGPELQRQFANSRGWRFRLASHGGGDYIQEQSVLEGSNNMPGAVVYERQDGKIYRKNACVFGPGDVYCSMWGLLALAATGEAQWTPQFNYWRRPEQLDDGGANLLE
ncbi:MAG: DUF899 family protein [Gammaproteobacteria bacterium]|nr:DUF899 family protein [Gammaproteobacteria bacterium]